MCVCGNLLWDVPVRFLLLLLGRRFLLLMGGSGERSPRRLLLLLEHWNLAGFADGNGRSQCTARLVRDLRRTDRVRIVGCGGFGVAWSWLGVSGVFPRWHNPHCPGKAGVTAGRGELSFEIRAEPESTLLYVDGRDQGRARA